MIVADREEIRVSETDDEILAFDVSDDVLERTATIIGGRATPVTMVWGILSRVLAPAPSARIKLLFN